jgi:hypothetical protein
MTAIRESCPFRYRQNNNNNKPPMIRAKHLLTRPFLRGLVLGLAAIGLSSNLATATPYASCLTNDGTTIWFRLNEAADDVRLVYNSDTVTNDLGAKPAGLNSVAVTLTGTYKLLVTKAGSPGIYQIGNVGIGTNVPVNSPRGIAVVGQASDPNFGRVYIANSAGGTKPDGISALYSDLSTNWLGHVPTNYSGDPPIPPTYPFVAAGSSSPFHIKYFDGKLYICDWSDYFGNLTRTDPEAYQYEFVLKELSNTNAGVIPVGTANNHGSVQSCAIQGSTGGNNMVVWSIDEDYQTDPTSVALYQMNSLWRYDVGSGPLPYTGTPKVWLGPSVAFTSQGYNTVSIGPTGFIYYNMRRENAGGPPGTGTWSPSLFIIDPNAYIDPTNFVAVYDPTNTPGTTNTYDGIKIYTLMTNYWPHTTYGGFVWESQSASIDAGGPATDLLIGMAANTISPDGNWLAGISYYNTIFMVPLTNGIPDLTRMRSLALGGSAAGRDIVWDPANNFYLVSSGLGQMRYYSLGLTATAITTSDGTFNLVVPAATVAVTATTPNAYEQGQVPGVFTVTRTGGTGFPLPVQFTMTGTATRGAATGYLLKTNNVTVPGNTIIFPPGSSSLTVSVVPNDDAVPELTQTAIFGVAAAATYNVDPAGPNATVYIVDNDTPELRIVSASTRIYEVSDYDFARVHIQRWGDTNVDLSIDPASWVCTGTAVSNQDYYVTVSNTAVQLPPGTVDLTVSLIGPIDNNLLDGTRPVTVTMNAGTGYTVVSNTASINIIDDEVPPEAVLWSDDFHTDTSTNYAVFCASTNGDCSDYNLSWAYDYSGIAIPLAPLSKQSGDTHGVWMTVNKGGGTAAGLNLYPTNQTFSGNYALRFDMFLTVNNSSGTTEYALFGINHSATKTNWFRNSAPVGGLAGVPAGWQYDGLFYDVEEDAAALGDYVLYTSPATGTMNEPTSLVADWAYNYPQTLKAPPFAYTGAPANVYGGTTPTWVQVEVSQVNDLVTLKINKTTFLTYQNTTSYKSGHIMLGYCDGYDSLGTAGASVIYANARVVAMPPSITSIVPVGGPPPTSYTINYDASAGFPTTVLYTSATVEAPMNTWTPIATNSVPGSGTFTGVSVAAPAFFRVQSRP